MSTGEAPAPQLACPSCGAGNESANRFCTECGYSLRGDAPGPRLPPFVTRPLDGAPNWERAKLSLLGTDSAPGEEEDLVVGRREGDYHVPGDPYLSGQHAVIRKGPGGYRLVDLGSKNGTFLRVRGSQGLAAGDVLMAGSQVLRVREWRRTDIIGLTPPAGMPAPGGREGGAPPRRESDNRFSLVRLVEGGGEAEVYPLPEDVFMIGRSVGDLVFPEDALLSDPHASLHPSHEPLFPLFVKDESSRNGVYVRMRESRLLEPGDMFAVGRQLFLFQPHAE